MQSRVMVLGLLVVSAAMAFGQLEDPIVKRDLAVKTISSISPDVRVLMNSDKVDRIYGAPFGGGFKVEQGFKNFVADYQDAFGVGTAKLQFTGTQPVMNGKFIAGYFEQRLQGYPVDGSSVTLLARNEFGNPIVLAVNHAKTITGSVPKPRITADQAKVIAHMGRPIYTEFKPAQLVIWTKEADYRLSWRFTALGEEDCKGCGGSDSHRDVAETIFVDAVNGNILERRNEIHEFGISGNVKGWVPPRPLPDTPGNPETLVNLPDLRVTIDGIGTVYTDANGNYTITTPGVGPYTVSASLVGRWVNVVNNGGTNPVLTQSASDPGPANFVFNDAAVKPEFDTALVNAYLETTTVHNFVKQYAPTYPGVDITLTCNVNQNNTCNANFNSGNLTINFFRAATTGTLCVNTAYSSVVYHEYGHFIINRAGTGQGSYGEGMGDTVAALLLDDNRLGMDFRGEGTGPLRNAVNTYTYPADIGLPIHTAGMIISGAFWNTLNELTNTYGRPQALNIIRTLCLNSIMLRPPGITPGVTIDVLTLDDNDANLSNGTPNYDEIAAGFGAKGLTAPPVEWVKVTPLNVPGDWVQHQDGGRFILRARVTPNASAPDLGQIKLFTRVNGGSWTSQNLREYVDNGYVFGAIPHGTCGDTVDWYIEAKDTEGRTTKFPVDGSVRSTIMADDVVPIFTDTFETNLAWTVVNHTSVTSGGWVRADPIGSFNGSAAANPEDDSNDSGAQCFFTGQGTVGGAVGAADLDGGPADLLSPSFDLAGSDALIDYRRWYYSVNGVPDTFTVSISNDGGTNWTNLETVTGVQNVWTQRTFRVSQFVTPTSNMRLRFRATDNPNDSVTEAAIDNVVIRRIICN